MATRDLVEAPCSRFLTMQSRSSCTIRAYCTAVTAGWVKQVLKDAPCL